MHDAESSVASFPPVGTAAQRMMLNRSRSAANDPNEESDQSILDDHVARNFPNTPPVPRSPPGASSMRSRSSKTSGMTRSSKSTGSGGTTKTLLHQSFDSRYCFTIREIYIISVRCLYGLLMIYANLLIVKR